MTTRIHQLCDVDEVIVDVANAVNLPNITYFPMYRKIANGNKTDIVAATPILQVSKILRSKFDEQSVSIMFTPVPGDDAACEYLNQAWEWEQKVMERTLAVLGPKLKHRKTFDLIENPFDPEDKTPCMKLILKKQPRTWLWGCDPSLPPVTQQFPDIGFCEGQRVVFNFSIKRLGKNGMADSTKFYIDVGIVFLVSVSEAPIPLFHDGMSAIPGAISMTDLIPKLEAQFSNQLAEHEEGFAYDGNSNQETDARQQSADTPNFIPSKRNNSQ